MSLQLIHLLVKPMKNYPSISSYEGSIMANAYVFHKYDGSNLRFEWNNKRGWYKFGTRTRLFDTSDHTFGTSIQLFIDKYESSLEELFKENKTKKAIVFCEWFGRKSFAGKHLSDDRKELIILDFCLDNHGFFPLKDFVQLPFHTAELLWKT